MPLSPFFQKAIELHKEVPPFRMRPGLGSRLIQAATQVLQAPLKLFHRSPKSAPFLRLLHRVLRDSRQEGLPVEVFAGAETGTLVRLGVKAEQTQQREGLPGRKPGRVAIP